MSTVNSITAYQAGTPYTGSIIGFSGGQAYERVYGVTIGNTGATQLVFTLTYTSRIGGDQAAIVNDTPECYTTTITNPGTVGVLAGSNRITFTISGQWIPGQTVYVHIFPYRATGGNVYSLNADYNTSVIAVEDVGVYGGLVRVWTGTAHKAIPYIRTTGRWRQCLAYIRHLTSWKMGV